MKRLYSSILVVGLAATLVGCTSARTAVIKEQPVDHPHRHEAAKVIGVGEDHLHVVNFMNRRAGKIGIWILDEKERPYRLRQERIRAEITRSDGSTEAVWLVGEGYPYQDWDTVMPGATVFSAPFHWVRDPHQVTLRVWIPLSDGNLYELTFECGAKEPYRVATGS